MEKVIDCNFCRLIHANDESLITDSKLEFNTRSRRASIRSPQVVFAGAICIRFELINGEKSQNMRLVLKLTESIFEREDYETTYAIDVRGKHHFSMAFTIRGYNRSSTLNISLSNHDEKEFKTLISKIKVSKGKCNQKDKNYIEEEELIEDGFGKRWVVKLILLLSILLLAYLSYNWLSNKPRFSALHRRY